MNDSDTNNNGSGTVRGGNDTVSPKLVSMRELSRALGVTLRAIQLAEIAGRISVVKRIQEGKRTRCYFDLQKSIHEFKSTSFKSQPLATRAQQGKGPQPMYNSKKERETPEGHHTHEAAIEAARLLDEGKSPVPVIAGKNDTQQPVKSNYTKLKEAKEALELQSKQLDMEERKGRLVNLDEAKLLFFQLANITVQNLLNVPDRIAPLLAAETDQRACRELVATEIKQALSKLVDGNFQLNKTA